MLFPYLVDVGIYLMYFRLFDIHITVDFVIFFFLCHFLFSYLVVVEMYHMYFRLFDIHVKIKCNSALGLQCLILINKPFIIINKQMNE